LFLVTEISEWGLNSVTDINYGHTDGREIEKKRAEKESNELRGEWMEGRFGGDETVI